MIDFTEIPDGEMWELFARDILQELGFFIEVAPDRGADGGRDIIVTEELKGYLGNYKFRWLVSCKHFAKSNRSVSENDEPNVRERLDSYDADGFIGFYSTVPSSGFNTRLDNLKQNMYLKDFKIFDHRVIENHLIRIGYSNILMRYFPESYKSIKPLHILLGEYIPLKCAYCDVDLLESLYREEYNGIVVFSKHQEEKDEVWITFVKDVYCCCKGRCDEELRKRPQNASTGWKDISDLATPILYLQWVFTHMNALRDERVVYTDQAYERLKEIIISISQKVLRETTERERERAIDIMSLPIF